MSTQIHYGGDGDLLTLQRRILVLSCFRLTPVICDYFFFCHKISEMMVEIKCLWNVWKQIFKSSDHASC